MLLAKFGQEEVIAEMSQIQPIARHARCPASVQVISLYLTTPAPLSSRRWECVPAFHRPFAPAPEVVRTTATLFMPRFAGMRVNWNSG